jgi:hypothetical protein
MAGKAEPHGQVTPDQPRRSGLRRLLGVASYLAFLVLVLEAGLQIFYWGTTGSLLFSRIGRPIYVADPHSGWAVQPNLCYHHRTPEFAIEVHTNSQGFRVSAAHEEYSVQRDDSRYRVLLLGPSFAFAWGVNYEDSVAALLPQYLKAGGFAGGREIEVINHGIPSLPPANNLRWYKAVGRDYRPDLVIQFAYGSLAVSSRPEEWLIQGGHLVRPDSTLRDRAIAYAKNSAIVFYGWTIATKLRSGGAREEGRIEGAGRELRELGEFDPDRPEVVDALKFYDELREAVESSGARLLILYFPLSYVVHPQDMSRWRHLGVRDVGKQRAFDEAFAEYLRQRGLACLDVTQRLIDTARSSGERLYYWLDVHWTRAGNAAVAAALAECLLADPRWALPRADAAAASINGQRTP